MMIVRGDKMIQSRKRVPETSLQKSCEEEKAASRKGLRKILVFRFHTDTDWLLFLVAGYKGFYEIRLDMKTKQ